MDKKRKRIEKVDVFGKEYSLYRINTQMSADAIIKVVEKVTSDTMFVEGFQIATRNVNNLKDLKSNVVSLCSNKSMLIKDMVKKYWDVDDDIDIELLSISVMMCLLRPIYEDIYGSNDINIKKFEVSLYEDMSHILISNDVISKIINSKATILGIGQKDNGDLVGVSYINFVTMFVYRLCTYDVVSYKAAVTAVIGRIVKYHTLKR